jgi:hypothetical protein
MTADQLILIVSAFLALLFAYVPGFANWFNPMEAEKKRLIMLGFLVLASAVVFGLSCAGVSAYVECTQAGLWGLVQTLILAVIANQGTFAILPKVGLNKSL